MNITRHAYNRLTERTDFTARQKNHNANQAYKYGYKISKFTGEFYEYLSGKQFNGDRTTVKILDNLIYVFDNRNRRLITVYPIPSEFLPISNYLEKNPVKCVIMLKNGEYLTEGNSDEPIIFKSKQSAENFIRNCDSLDSECMVVMLG